jgi:hypothetical protein
MYAQYINNLECLYWPGWNVTVPVSHRVKISCDYGTNNCNDSDTRVVGNLRDPTKLSRDILLQVKGITWIESTQIRWLLRWSGGWGWSSRAKLSGGQESQIKGQGTVRLPTQGATTEAARQGARGQNKELLSWYLVKKKTELKAALTRTQ